MHSSTRKMMRINIKVKVFASEEKVVQSEKGDITVYVKEPPSEGRANDAVIRILSGYFKVPKSTIRIISGHRSRNKIIEIK
ncbi:MAG TPA: DUF167 domain-containing protein [bacterium]|nr:DUF167 domain-containing protein [bacterium]